MMKNNSKTLVLMAAILGVMVFTTRRSDAKPVAQSDFFREGVTGRAFGMGNAFVGLADDIGGIYWNSAGLAQLESAQLLTTNSNREFMDSDIQTFSAAVPLRDVSLGLNYVESGTSFPVYGFVGGRPTLLGTGTERYTGTSLAVAGKITPELLAGLNIKFLNYKLLANKDSGTGFDIGFLYRHDNYKIGVNFQNLGGVDVGTDEVPFNFQIGGSVKALENLTVAMAYDSNYLDEGVFNIGAELQVVKEFAIRIGSTDGDFTYGFGVNFQNFQIDYASCSGSDECETNIFTVAYTFPPRKSKASK